MGSDQAGNGQRQDRYMQGEEASQCRWSDKLAAAEKLHQKRTGHRDGTDTVGGHGGRPEGELAPGEQIAGQGNPHNQIEEDKPGEPVQLPRLLVAPHEQDRQHMEKEYQHHHVRADRVAHPDQPAEGDVVHDKGDTLERLVSIRDVIDQQQDAGHDL